MSTKEMGYAIRKADSGQVGESEPILYLSGTVVRDSNSVIKNSFETHVRPLHNGKLNGWIKGNVSFDGADTLRIRAETNLIRFRKESDTIVCLVNSKEGVVIDEESATIIRSLMEQATIDSKQSITYKGKK